jgi:DASS family divalent anion:Na+ symporter
MVSRFGGSPLGLAYSIVLTDAVIAPAFPSNTARGGVLFPIVLSVAKGAGSEPDQPEGRRLGGYLMFCAMASLAFSSALWLTATSCRDRRTDRAKPGSVGWKRFSPPPCHPRCDRRRAFLVSKIFSLQHQATPRAPAAQGSPPWGDIARREDHGRDHRGDGRRLGVRQCAGSTVPPFAFTRFGVLMVAGVLRARRYRPTGRHARDLPQLRCTRHSAQLNELGFWAMWASASRAWAACGRCSTSLRPVIGLHYTVSQASQMLALLPSSSDVSVRGPRVAPLIAQASLRDSYFSGHPQGGKNIIFVARGYLGRGELWLSLLTPIAFMTVYC